MPGELLACHLHSVSSSTGRPDSSVLRVWCDVSAPIMFHLHCNRQISALKGHRTASTHKPAALASVGNRL